MKIKKRYIIIHDWMISKLNLSGKELLIYALIFSYTEKKNGFIRSLPQMQGWTGLSAIEVESIIVKFIERDIISETLLDNSIVYIAKKPA